MTTVESRYAVLDNAIWSSLAGPHAALAERHGSAARYPDEIAVFQAIADPDDPAAWAALATLNGPGAAVLLARAPVAGARGGGGNAGAGVQLVDVGLRAEPDPEAVVLGAADVPEILDLVERTKPGPFRPRTIELGTYLGIRRDGRLVALAGERLHPPGWTEISAVCTDPAFRRQGLGTRLVRAVAYGIRARGETPLMHASADNTNAIRLYESIGFHLRRTVTFGRFRSVSPAG